LRLRDLQVVAGVQRRRDEPLHPLVGANRLLEGRLLRNRRRGHVKDAQNVGIGRMMDRPFRCRRETADHGAASSALHVFGPTIPSGTRPCWRWNSRTAASVTGPKVPVGVAIPSCFWSCSTKPPLAPRRRVGRPTAPDPFGGSAAGIGTSG